MFIVNVLYVLVLACCYFVDLVCLFMLCLCYMFIDLMVVGVVTLGICCLEVF